MSEPHIRSDLLRFHVQVVDMTEAHELFLLRAPVDVPVLAQLCVDIVVGEACIWPHVPELGVDERLDVRARELSTGIEHGEHVGSGRHCGWYLGHAS